MDEDIKTFSDYLVIFLRRRKLILLIATAVLLAGVIVAYTLTPTYVAVAKFRVEQQSVSTDLVQSAVTGFADERIQAVRQRVMSAPNLSMLIQKHDLYPELVGIELSHIAIDLVRTATVLEPEYAEVFSPISGRSSFLIIGFSVAFEYSDPETTRSVATEIANLYLLENERDRTEQVEETISFLESGLETSRQDIDESSAALAAFRERHAGNLPDMTDFNLQAMERTERQIDGLDEQIRDARDRKLVLEGELADPNLLATAYDAYGEPIVGTAQRLAELQREKLRLISIYSAEHPDVIKVEKEIEILSSGMPSGGVSASEIQRQLDNARIELTEAQQRYADDHPDVRRLTRTVDGLQLQLNETLRRPAPSVSLATQDPVVQQIRLRIRAQENDIQTFQNRRAELVAKISEYERKMAGMPQIERQYAVLTRNNEAAEARYNDTREKLAEARTSGKLESEGAGDRFILTDPPQLPLSPARPNRMSILILTVVLALVFGATAAITLDSMDKTVRDSRDLLQFSDAPPIAIIPFLETPGERRKRVGINLVTSGVVASGFILAIIIAKSTA